MSCTTVTPDMIAIELGMTAPDQATAAKWRSRIDRAERAIRNRATRLGVPFDSLDPDTVADVVIYAVVRRESRSLGGAESTTDQIGVDDGTWSQTRRYRQGEGDVFILDEWWKLLGLVEPDMSQWSGSIPYLR